MSRFLFPPRHCSFSLRRNIATYYGNRQPEKGDKVVVAMSGGVDSSVTAKLLADKDCDLSAVFMRNWDTRDESGSDRGCEWEKDWEDVQRVCSMLNIPCRMVDLSREYWSRVFEPSLRAWESGATPNPDVWCNKEVKFGALIQRLLRDDVLTSTSWLATGHYARSDWASSDDSSLHRRPRLLRARDITKDQTYYLSSITEESLSRSLFPIGHLTKKEVRELAAQWNLPTARKDESMGICFIGEKRKFHDFIAQYIEPNPGPILNLNTGAEVALHQGLWTYTIGQGAKIRGMPQRMYVARKDKINNIIYVVPGTDHEALYSRVIHVEDMTWIWADSLPPELAHPSGLKARIKFRHVMSDVGCTIYKENSSGLRIVFDEPQKAIAPGQIAAVWLDDWCCGCGVIVNAE